MKSKLKCKLKLILFLFFTVVFSCSRNTSFKDINKLNHINKEIECRGTIIKLGLIRNYKEYVDNYEEGFYNTFAFNDSAYITIHCGSLIKVPILSSVQFNLLFERKDAEKESRFGSKSNNRYWREDKYKNKFIIYYDNVNYKDKIHFDSILDNLTQN